MPQYHIAYNSKHYNLLCHCCAQLLLQKACQHVVDVSMAEHLHIEHMAAIPHALPPALNRQAKHTPNLRQLVLQYSQLLHQQLWQLLVAADWLQQLGVASCALTSELPAYADTAAGVLRTSCAALLPALPPVAVSTAAMTAAATSAGHSADTERLQHMKACIQHVSMRSSTMTFGTISS
jgi:hypothetical protein